MLSLEDPSPPVFRIHLLEDTISILALARRIIHSLGAEESSVKNHERLTNWLCSFRIRSTGVTVRSPPASKHTWRGEHNETAATRTHWCARPVIWLPQWFRYNINSSEQSMDLSTAFSHIIYWKVSSFVALRQTYVQLMMLMLLYV